MNENEVIITEKFFSLDGEGIYIGTPTIFIRFFGCNLSCPFCDTPFSIKKIDDTVQTVTIDSIVDYILSIPLCKRVVFTGGEPMLQVRKIQMIIDKLESIIEGKYDYQVETNGTIYSNVLHSTIVYAISPKFHALDKKYIESLKEWNLSIHRKFFKFVYEGPETVFYIKKLEEEIGGFGHRTIYLMPEGRTFNVKKYRKCADVCLKNGWSLSIRLQCLLWNDERGT
jgi:7-carboxy-7-deazaguanine synthase